MMDFSQFYTKLNVENSGWYNDPAKVEFFINAGYLTRAGYEKLTGFISVLNEVYPERWDIHFTPCKFNNNLGNTGVYVFQHDTSFWKVYPLLLIYFPELHLKSQVSNGKHTLYDLIAYIPLVWEEDSFTIRKLFTMRYSFTPAEIANGYVFSHATTGSLTQNCSPRRCCLGDGEINQTMALFNSENDLNWFKMLMFQLPLYFSWESKDGGAYYYIADLVRKKSIDSISFTSYMSEIQERVEKSIQEGTSEISLSFTSNGKGYSVVPSDRFEGYITTILKEMKTPPEFFVLKEKMSYYKPASLSKRKLPKSRLLFRGNLIPFRTIKDKEEESKLNFVAHPDITTYARNYLDSKFSKKVIENYLRTRLRDSNLSRKIRVGYDQISL